MFDTVHHWWFFRTDRQRNVRNEWLQAMKLDLLHMLGTGQIQRLVFSFLVRKRYMFYQQADDPTDMVE